MSETNKNGPVAVRAILQQVLSAKLQVRPPSDEIPAEYVEVNKGLVIYICFLKGAQPDSVSKIVKSLLNVQLSFSEEKRRNVSILELPGDILVVPQATLGGKMKGKAMQYHSNIAKDEGKQLYESFVSECQVLVKQKWNERGCTDEIEPLVKFGTYGNRQVLSMDTNGPYTHFFEFP